MMTKTSFGLGVSLLLASAGSLFAQADATVAPTEMATPASVVTDGPLVRAINQRLGVAESSLAELDTPDILGPGFDLQVPLDGEWVTLSVTPHSNRSPAYKVLAQVAEDTYVDIDPAPVNTFRGEVAETFDALVAGSLLDDGIHAIVRTDDSNYWIEPASKYNNDAPENVYVIYKSSDRVVHPGLCACTDDQVPFEPADTSTNGTRGTGDCGGLCVAELGVDCDVEYYQQLGNSTTAVQDRVNQVINAVNLQYESQTGITHAISAIIIRTVEPDPYSSSDGSTLLNQFASFWNSNTPAARDVGLLFTGKNISTPGQGTSTIGIAQLSAICTSGGYGAVERFNPFDCATDLSAHELGHIWSATHTSQTMNSSLTCANNFGATSISQITNHRNSRTCLDAAESGTTTIPFFDDFPTTTIDDTKWTGIDDVFISSASINPPSAPNALNVSGSREIRSAIMDTSLMAELMFSYQSQEGGNSNPPETNEDLIVEYLNDVGQWIEVARELGAGGAENTFSLESVDLTNTEDAYHTGFRIRFRGVSNANDQNADVWWIDDVSITARALELPGSFFLLSPANGADEIPADNVQLDWSDSTNATTYTVEIDDDAGFGSIDLQLTGLTSSEATITSGLDNGTLYFWRVTAEALDGTVDGTPSSYGFQTAFVAEEFGTIELRYVASDDESLTPNTLDDSDITLAAGETSVELYVQARVVDDPDATGIVTFDGALSDDGSGTFAPELLSNTEAIGAPVPGDDFSGRTGMFVSYRSTIGPNNGDPGNGNLFMGNWLILPLNIEPAGNGQGINGNWSTIYKLTWSTPDTTARVVTLNVDAEFGGYQRSAANGGLADRASITPDSINITITEDAGCPCDQNSDDIVDVLDLLEFLSFWFPLDNAADYNNDTVIDVLDLLDFLSCWFPATAGSCP